MLSEEGFADDGRWILMMRRSDVFGDGLVLWEFEDGAGLGLVAVVVRRRPLSLPSGRSSTFFVAGVLVSHQPRTCFYLFY